MARQWKPKPWVQYVLPGLIVSMGVLILLSLAVDEFTFLTCDDVRSSLLDAHNPMVVEGWDEATHLKYHTYYDKCLADGAYSGLSEDWI